MSPIYNGGNSNGIRELPDDITELVVAMAKDGSARSWDGRREGVEQFPEIGASSNTCSFKAFVHLRQVNFQTRFVSA
jgi:hypothetical protein